MMKKLLQNQFVKFLFIGVLNTFFGYSLFALLIYSGLHYSVASALATIMAVLFNFNTTGKFVFDSHDNTLLWKFFGVYGVVYILNILGLYLFEKMSINAYIAGAILIFPMALVSFWLNKKFVFRG